jgi:transcriptional regulator with XRE-family HTH domain
VSKSKESVRAAVCVAVARLLRERRERLGLSMSDVAQKAGLSQQMVSYVERSMRNPTLDTLLRLSDALELNLPTLLQKACRDRDLPDKRGESPS